MKKTLLGVFMAVVLLMTTVFSVVLTTVSAANEDGMTSENVVYTIQTVETNGLKAGDTFTVDVTVNAVNNLGGVEFYFAYDNTLVKATKGETKGALAAMDMKDVVVAPKGDKDGDASTGEVWITGMKLEQLSTVENEVIATVTFEALADITASVPMFSVGEAWAATHAVTDHNVSTVDGGLKVSVNWGAENTDGETPENVVYTVGTVDGTGLKAGDTVSIDISTNGIHNIAGVELYLAYDKTKMTAVSSEIKGYLAEMEMKTANIAPNGDKDGDPMTAEVWITGMIMSQLSSDENEVIATITFELLADLTENVQVFATIDPWAATHMVVDHVASVVNGGVQVNGAEMYPTTTTTEPTTTTTTMAPTMPTVTETTTTEPTTTEPATPVTGPSSVVEQDGLTVVMTTDKASYTESENITATVKVTNNKDASVYKVNLQTFIPEGYVLAEGYTQYARIAELKAGETVELTVVLVPEAFAPTTTTTEKTLATVTTTTANKGGTTKPSSPQTGDGSLAITMLILGLSAAAVAGAVALKNRKYRQMLSLVLVCALSVSALSVVVPVTNASAATGVDPIEVSVPVTVADKEISLRAAVNYSLTSPPSTMVVYGDSITAEGTWPLEVSKNTNMYHFNGGLQGLNTERAVAQFQTYVADRNPDYVVFNFGHIDMQRKKNGPGVALEDYKANLKKLCEDTVAIGAIPVLLTPNTMEETEWRGSFMQNKKDYADDGGPAKVLEMYCDAVRAVAAEGGYDLVDVHAEMSKYEPTEVLKAGGVFPNDKGNKVIADVLTTFFNTKYPQSADTEKAICNFTHTAPAAAGDKLDIIDYDAAAWQDFDPKTWESVGTIKMENDANGTLSFFNTDGLWPCAYQAPVNPVYVPYEGTELVVDITPASGVNASIVFFFAGSTPNGVSEKFSDDGSSQVMTMQINTFLGCPTDPGSGDIIGGNNVKATIKLSDLKLEENVPLAIDEKGNVLISGVKIFAAGAANTPVVVNELAVVASGAPNA